MKKTEIKWKWFGKAGHFCMSDRCLFHLCTDVGDYLVSSVGDMHPDMSGNGLGEQKPIGWKHLYETMVFKKKKGFCKCGCGIPNKDLGEVEYLNANSETKCESNHMKLCLKYSTGAKDE